MFSAHHVYAEDAAEEVVVTGIRGSLDKAMDIKKESVGVVDAISSEDMGKFPDTNLAESLQRISGVSISRQNGEGNEITVRGFGAENNMITLNGRTMPTGTTYAGGSGADATTKAGGSRAFNFANIASDNISGVEVYKTSKANIAPGGIGATVNIKTARPLDKSGLSFSVGGKALMDTTNEVGSDVTPEVSGVVSWSDDNQMFGAALALSSSQRDSGSAGVTVNNWNIGVGGTDKLYDTAPNSVFNKVPANGELYARPNDFRYGFSDFSRERLNGQLTLQYRPVENFTATVDYTLADNDIEENRGEVTNWVQNGSNISSVVFDGSTIKTPLTVSEAYRDASGAKNKVDIGFEQQYRSQNNKLDSLGLNLEFKVNDSFKVLLDAHDSTMESTPTGPGGSGEVAFGMGAPVVTDKTINFTRDIPTYTHETTVPGNALTDAHVGSSILRILGSGSKNDITQIKLDGVFELEDDARFEFGVDSISSEMEAYQTAGDNQALGNWGINNPGEFAGTGLIKAFNIGDRFEDFDVSASPQVAFRGDAVALTRAAMNLKKADGTLRYPDAHLRVSPNFANKDKIEEDTSGAYFQVGLKGEVAGFETKLLTGLRYETTDVSSTSLAYPPPFQTWENNNDFSNAPSTTTVSFSKDSNYDNMLPSLDFSVNFNEDLVGRFSYSQTIARPGYGNLRAAPSNFGRTGSSFNNYKATAQEGNPGLLPLKSNNVDFSLEWYFGETSYVSGGVFEKRVSNFIGTSQQDKTHFDIRDQTTAASPFVQAAAADLKTLGFQTDDTNLYAMMVLKAHPAALTMTRKEIMSDAEKAKATPAELDAPIFPNGVYEATGDQLKLLGERSGWDIGALGTDPLTVFSTSFPVNDKEAKLYGAELAVQHFFGETGFGVQANYTIVRGDVKFIDLGLPTVDQFALTGLSDTANLVLMYENFGFQGRLAYNWRGEFLTETNQGSSRNPRYVEAYSQIDFSVGYNITDDLSVNFEGLNITGEDSREHNRNDRMIRFADDLGARFALGARYKY
ncbi:MAG TPA: TonB-dependent receptor [Cellvibrionaceae bacterium]